MAYQILSNRKNASAVIHFSASNSALTVAGNTSTSNVAVSDETLTGASITQAVWGCDGTGHIQVYRGANLVAVYDSTAQVDYAGCGMSLTKDSAATLDVRFVGSGNAYLIIEIQKIGSGSSDYIKP